MSQRLAQSELGADKSGVAAGRSANWMQRGARLVRALAGGAEKRSGAVEAQIETAENDERGRPREKALHQHEPGRRARLEASAQTVDESGRSTFLVVEPREVLGSAQATVNPSTGVQLSVSLVFVDTDGLVAGTLRAGARWNQGGLFLGGAQGWSKKNLSCEGGAN